MKQLTLLLLVVSVVSCRKDPEPFPDISSGLVVNIPLDGSAYDSVSGTIGVASHIVPIFDRHGDPNKSILFSRDDSSQIDFGDLSLASFPDNIFTISCWINVIDTLSPVAILSKRGVVGPWEYSIDNHFYSYGFSFDNWTSDGGKTVYGIDPLKALATFQIAVWHHLVYSADGSILRVYLDGVLQQGTDQLNLGNSFTNTDGHFVVGNGGGYGRNYFFNGCIDDIRIYNRVLDEMTIKYLSSL